jgi:hypothetical protein
MSTVDQLLAKAMSTPSEDEAIACLRMARKRGIQPSVQPTHDIAYWKKKATEYYDAAISIQKTCRSAIASQELWKKHYQDAVRDRNLLKKEKDQLKNKLIKHRLFTVMIFFSLLFVLIAG